VLGVIPPKSKLGTPPPRFIPELAEGTIPSDAGEDAAPGLLADGIGFAPLADMAAFELADGVVLTPLAENGLGFDAGAGVGGRNGCRFARKFCCAAVVLFGPRGAIISPHR